MEEKSITGNMAFIKELLDFLEESFRNPLQAFRYLKSRKECSQNRCKVKGCDRIIASFSGQRPWDNLKEFYEWSWQWSPNNTYEWPIGTVFLVPVVAQFLESKGMKEESIKKGFRMEFTGGGKKELFVPLCLWKKNPFDSVCIEKKFQGHYMCCDFLLLPPFPAIVAEVKVAVPQTAKKIFSAFWGDLNKCEEWMAQDASPFIKNKFNIDRFEYSLAILIDLSGEKGIQNIWKSSVNEEEYLRRGIFAKLISPIFPAVR